jgi:hypothetical protein
MKVLIILNYRQDKSGITNQIAELKKGLEKEGIEVRLVSTYGNIFERFSSIVKALKESKRSDIIIAAGCAYFGFYPIFVGSLVGTLRKKKVIVNFHDGLGEKFLKQCRIIPGLVIGGKTVVVASEFLVKVFKQYGYNVVLIPNHFFKTESIIPNLNNRVFEKRVIWARSFEKLYRPELALEVAEVVSKKTGAFFDFYGDGSLYNELSRKFKSDNIRFFGFVPRETLLKKYAEYDIFLNTSEYDNFPLSIVEAGLNKLLVITSAAQGIASTYTYDEVIYAHNKDEFINKLLDVMENYQKYDNVRINLFNRVQGFNWENVKHYWLNLIKGK